MIGKRIGLLLDTAHQIMESRESTDHHLTADGWVEGTSKVDNMPAEEVSIPVDRVLTVQEIREQYSFGDESVNLQVTFTSTDQEVLNALIAKYGERPQVREAYRAPRRGKKRPPKRSR